MTKAMTPLVLMAALAAAVSALAAPTPIRVPDDHATIQAAIDAASAVPGTHEVVVAPGTYQECLDIDRPITVRSDDPEDPAIVGKTILKPAPGSSEPVVTITHGTGNSYAYLRGFTITGCTSSSGAVFCAGDSLATVSRCVIASNSGPGVRLQPGSAGTVVHCIVRNNGASGVEYWYCTGFVKSCSIFNNQGTGVWVTGLATAHPLVPPGPQLTHVGQNLIYGNGSASTEGGGILCTHGANPEIRRNTIVRNSGGFGSGVGSIGSAPSLRGCIIAFNEGAADVQCDEQNPISVRYCNVFGLPGNANYHGMDDPTGADGNISEDPLFADAAHSDYHLRSAAGRWLRGQWVTDDVTSPCIDADDPNVDVADEPAPNGGRVNMGAYGGTEYASKSPAIRAPRTPRGGGR